MTKLNINIKVKEFEELAPAIESVKKTGFRQNFWLQPTSNGRT